MKKLLLIIATMMVTVTASSQTEKLLNFGLEAGMNFNSLSFSGDLKENFNSSNRLGFFVGPKLKVNLPLFGFGADVALLYSMNGNNVSSESAVEKVSENLSYFEIPLNLRYSFGLKAVSIYLATGPRYNLCLNSDASLKSMYENFNGAVSRSSWGWNVGAGLELFNHLQLGVTYTIPISDNGQLTKDEFSNIFSNYKQKTVKLRLAYYF
jgi:opacity protein-like surface antigen